MSIVLTVNVRGYRVGFLLTFLIFVQAKERLREKNEKDENFHEVSASMARQFKYVISTTL